jgi:hypothetical protein
MAFRGKKTEVGNTLTEFMTETVGTIPAAAIRLGARGVDLAFKSTIKIVEKGKEGYAKAATKYGAELSLFNLKINSEAKKMIELFASGDFAGAFSAAGNLISFAFKRYFILPIKTFAQGLKYALIGTWAAVEKAVKNKTGGFISIGDAATNAEKELGEEIKAISQIQKLLDTNKITEAQKQILDAKSKGYDTSTLESLMDMLKQQEQQRIIDDKKKADAKKIQDEENRNKDSKARKKDYAAAYVDGKKEYDKQMKGKDKKPEMGKGPYEDVILNLIKGGLIKVQ